MLSVYPSFNKSGGGVSAVTAVLARNLSRCINLNVHVVTLERGKKKLTIERDGDITIHRLPASNWPQILDILFGPGKKKLLHYIKQLKPDILHIHETYGLGLGTLPIPHVFTVHGFDHANLIADSARYAWIRSQLWRYVERRGFSTQKHIISITPYVRKMIEPLTNANIYDIDNPVDEQFFNIKPRLEQGRILCVGWINERKNTLGSVRAFAQIADNYPQAKLVIAGEAKETEYFNQVKQFIEQEGIVHRVEMLGYVNTVKLEEELTKASIFLLPSRQENSPMAIAEAMAVGIPVIASNRCGMPYMVEEGRTGFLIDPESTEQIADCLAKLINSPELCRKMGQAGREIARRRFHPQKVAEKTLGVYRQVCADVVRPC